MNLQTSARQHSNREGKIGEIDSQRQFLPRLGSSAAPCQNAIVCLFALLPAPCGVGTKIVWNHELEKRESLQSKDKAPIKDCDGDTGRHKEKRKDAK